MFPPVIKWTGSKRSQAAEILKHFPREMDTYYEPFVGGGSIMRALLESDVKVNRIVCSDINNDLIRLWQEIKDYPQQLADRYEELWNQLTAKDDDKARKISFYNAIRTRFNDDRCPADFLFLLRTCANGMPRYNGSGDFNTSFHITRDGIRPETLRQVILDWSALLNRHNVQFLCRSYNELQTQTGDFLYLDPPYAATKGIYYGSLDNDAFFSWLGNQKGGYALSFNGYCDGTDSTYQVPNDLFDRHLYLRSGNSSFRRVGGKSSDSIVYESLYIKNSMNNKLIIGTPDASGEDNNWNLHFRHYMFHTTKLDENFQVAGKALRVGIILEAVRQRPDSQLDEEMTLATTSFLPGKKPEKMLFSVYDDNSRLTDALISHGFAQQDGDRLDMTGFYDSYMQQHQQMMMDSPVSHVRYHEDPDNALTDGYISCRIGGIEQPKLEVGLDGHRFCEAASFYPDCKFQLHELAVDIFGRQLMLYREAQKRVTDFTLLHHTGNHYIRCKIDGVQQLMKQINRLDACDFQLDRDQAALVAKYFGSELNPDIKLSQGRSR